MIKMRLFDAMENEKETENMRVIFNGVGDISNIVTKLYASENPNEETPGWVEVLIQYKSINGVGYLYDNSAMIEPIKVKIDGLVMWNNKDE